MPLADCNQFVLSKSSVGHAAAVLNILTMWLAVMIVVLAGRYFFGSPFLGWQEEIAFQSLLLLLLVGYRARLYSVNHQLMMRMWLYPIINSALLFVLFAEMTEEY